MPLPPGLRSRGRRQRPLSQATAPALQLGVQRAHPGLSILRLSLSLLEPVPPAGARVGDSVTAVTVHEEEQAVREYETTFIVQPEISDEGREAMLQKLDALIEKQGAVRLAVDDVGKRKLAYEIQKFQKGHYYTLQYLDRGPAVKELERTLRLEESVLRFLTVMVNEEVTDIEGRKAAAAEEERLRKQRAAERAAREAEEERAREQAEREARAAASAAPFANAVDPDDVESEEEPDEDEE